MDACWSLNCCMALLLIKWTGITPMYREQRSFLGFRAKPGLCTSWCNNLMKDTVILEEFISPYDAPFESCHASTIVQGKAGLLAAWFGGTHEGHPDVGIWLSRNDGDKWSEPVEVASGVSADGTRHPCWNPVLFQPRAGPLMLFYKVGPHPTLWKGMMMISDTDGATWSAPLRLPEGILGPIKNKPIELPDGTILCGCSTENGGWQIHFEFVGKSADNWRRTEPVPGSVRFKAIQPALLQHTDGRIQALCRSTSGNITQTWSDDGGENWTPMTRTELPNPDAGIDAVTLRDGRHVLAYNHNTNDGEPPYGRDRLNIAVSSDGKRWSAVVELRQAKESWEYPAVIQTTDDLIHISCTFSRRLIKHLVLNPAELS